MLKVKTNFIYLAVILAFSVIIFCQSNIAFYRPTYIRANQLEIFSIEFWTLIIFLLFIIYIFVRHTGFLFEKFIIGFFASIILTDSVYKFASVQISDIFSFLAIFVYYSRMFLIKERMDVNVDFLKKPPGIFMLVTLFTCFISLLAPGCSYFYEKITHNLSFSITSWSYLVRIMFLFLFCNILYEISLNNNKLINVCLKVLLWAGILGCIVYWIQIGLYTFNICDVNGIFNDFGFPRAKGLAHEPATFAHSLLFITILSLINLRRMNLKILFVILTMIATFSLGTYITAILCILTYYFYKFISGSAKTKEFAIIASFIGVIIAIAYYLGGDTVFKFGYKLVYHIQNKLFEHNQVIDELFRQYPSVKLFGIGLYNSVQPFADTFEVRNSYSLIYQDTGLLGFISFITLLLYNLFICFKNSINDGKFLLFSYIISYCVITLSVIRFTFFPFLWVGLTLFYVKSLFNQDLEHAQSYNNSSCT